MKKIFFSLLAAATLLTSCDMDLRPAGQLDDETAIQNVNDVARFRAGLYASLRSFTTSGFFTDPEIQMDMFQGTIINGNRGGTFANGSILSSDGDITGYWAAIYSFINDANFLIEKAEPILEQARAAGDAAAVAALERYVGEAHFIRGYYYGEMFDRWCTVYSADKADQAGLGLPLVSQYYPTADRSHYPGRSSMNETLAFINADLSAALNGLLAYEATQGAETPAPMASYVTSDAVKAFQARLALWTGDYAGAIAKANEVIDSDNYALADVDSYDSMWINDNSDEIIFMPYMSAPSELSGSIGDTWLSIYNNKADYIPSYGALSMYTMGDIRFDAYFDTRRLEVEGATVPCFCFYKFPGNPALQATAGSNNIMNRPKALRLSEMYLILAEAAACSSTPQTTVANAALNELRRNRIENYNDDSYSGNVLIEQIRSERTKELIGEGFRMSDLRRWNQGFTRDYSHPENPAVTGILVPAGASVVYHAGDYRYTWPIPATELTVNPQMAGQQNPGY